LRQTIERIKGSGIRAGVALNPATPLEAIEPVVEDVDLILIMTVNPGFGGQEFLPATLPKVREARRMLESRSLKADLAVDGGINERTAPLAVEAGANVLVIGFAFYGQGLSARKLKESLGRIKNAE
jgi:ribulose-phosphate 3-epimerase